MGASPYRENAAVAPGAKPFMVARALGAACVGVLGASMIVFVLRARSARGAPAELMLADPGVAAVSKPSNAVPSPASLAHAEDALEAPALPSPPSIADVVRMNEPSLQYLCWEKAPQRKRSVHATVDVVVGPTGVVESALASGGGPGLNDCLENGVSGWRFPRVGLRTKIEVPFSFTDPKNGSPRRAPCACKSGDPMCSCLE